MRRLFLPAITGPRLRGMTTYFDFASRSKPRRSSVIDMPASRLPVPNSRTTSLLPSGTGTVVIPSWCGTIRLREILEHRRPSRIDAVQRQEFLVGPLRRFRLSSAAMIEHRSNAPGRAAKAPAFWSVEPLVRSFRRAVCDRSPHHRVRLERRDRSCGRRRDNRRRNAARSSCRASWCRSANNSPSGRGARFLRIDEPALTNSPIRASTCATD